VFAEQHRIATLCIPTLPNEEAADERLCQVMTAANVQIIILSGYLRRLGPKTLKRFQNRILNTHPALLPKFGGKGMYGRRVHEAVLAAREQTTGATIHLADGEYDHGRVLAQRGVAIDAADDPDGLGRKVMEAEGSLLVEVLTQVADGSLRADLNVRARKSSGLHKNSMCPEAATLDLPDRRANVRDVPHNGPSLAR
jgi:phosphoribosylglycinamide formyltransferase-1